jgi:hypothetical protein
MDKIKKIYVDSRFKTNDSVSNSDFKYELKEQIELPDNTVCYVDDISIPHSWYSVEDYNNKLYIGNFNDDLTLNKTKLTIPNGNYTGVSLASAIQSLLYKRFPNDDDRVYYESSRGILIFESLREFTIFTDDEVMELTYIQPPFAVWNDVNNEQTSAPELGNAESINEILRNTLPKPTSTKFETEFLDLINTHNIYIHSPSLGFNYNTIGCKGENSIIKKVPVSSGFGYQILDTVVAPHDKIDVSRQNIKTLHFSLKNVFGNTINLHGSNVSWSLIFVTMD